MSDGRPEDIRAGLQSEQLGLKSDHNEAAAQLRRRGRSVGASSDMT